MYCKYCGKSISDDSVYCSYCGAKQDGNLFLNNSPKKKNFTGFYDTIRKAKAELKQEESKDTIIEIPNGYVYCSYCGIAKPVCEFKISNDSTYHVCKNCKSREDRVSLLPFVLGAILLVILTIIGIIIEGWIGLVTLLCFPLYGILLIPGFIIGHLIEKRLENTSLRVSLSKERKEYLSECTDTNGKKIIHPVEYSELEEAYHRATGVYRSKDIQSGFFKCPCCENELSNESEYRIMDGSDTSQRHLRPSWVGGNRIEVTTNKYRYKICPDCFKYRKIGNRLPYYFTILGVILGLLPPLVELFGGYDDTMYIFISLIFCTFGGAFLGVIIKYLYLIIAGAILHKDLIVTYYTVARNGALTRRKP